MGGLKLNNGPRGPRVGASRQGSPGRALSESLLFLRTHFPTASAPRVSPIMMVYGLGTVVYSESGKRAVARVQALQRSPGG